MASIFQRGKTFWIQYYLNGKRIQKTLKTRDRKIAKYHKNKIENELAQGDSPIAINPITPQIALDEFHQNRSGRVSAGTVESDRPRLQWFIDSLKNKSLSSVTEANVKKHIDKLIEEKDISAMTANHNIRIIKTFLNFCVKRKYIQENPIQHMPKYKVNTVEQRYLSEDEIRTLFAIARETRLYLLILTAIYTGMRFGELDRLQWEDVDFKENNIRVVISKSGKFRNIPIHPVLRKELEEHRMKSGKVINTTHFQGLFDDIRKECVKNGVQHFRFHDLRHTFCSLLIKNGVDIVTVSKLAGHTTIKTTMTYAHLYQDHVKEAIQKINF